VLTGPPRTRFLRPSKTPRLINDPRDIHFDQNPALMSTLQTGLTRGRKAVVRLLAVVGFLSFSFMFVFVVADALGAISSEPVGSPDDPPPSAEARAGARAPGEGVHVVGALGVVALVGSGLVGLIARPARAGSAYQVLAGVLGVLVVLPVVGDPDNVGGQAGVIDPAFLVLAVPPLLAATTARPWRSARPRRPMQPVFLALAGLALVPGAWYGVNQALMQRNTFPPTADPHHQAHWFAMAVFAFVVILTVATGTLAARGWRLATGTAGLSVVVFGTASLADSAAASALAPLWAGAAVVWGVAVLWLTAQATTVQAYQ